MAAMGRPDIDPLQSAMISTGQRGSGLSANSRSPNSSSKVRSSPSSRSSLKRSSASLVIGNALLPLPWVPGSGRFSLRRGRGDMLES